VAKVSRNEVLAVAGGLALLLGLFLPWYATSDNPNARIDGVRGAVTGFEVHDVLRWLHVLAAIAPFVLAWVIIRGHHLSWARGEMTAVIAIAAFGLVAYNGLIDRPGSPSGEIGLRFGFWLALLGTMLMIAGAALRSSETERRRKPPGVL
jgi:hypothetical protein